MPGLFSGGQGVQHTSCFDLSPLGSSISFALQEKDGTHDAATKRSLFPGVHNCTTSDPLTSFISPTNDSTSFQDDMRKKSDLEHTVQGTRCRLCEVVPEKKRGEDKSLKKSHGNAFCECSTPEIFPFDGKEAMNERVEDWRGDRPRGQNEGEERRGVQR